MRSKHSFLPCLLAAALLLGGQSPVQAGSDKAVSFYQDATSRFEKKDLQGAIVQLKNALQVDPGMLAAQMMLGKVYLADSQPEGAQEAFEKALRLGVDRGEVTIPLGHALLRQGKGAEFLERFNGDVLSGAVRAEYLVLRGHALRQGKDADGAMRAFEEAMSLDPRSVEAPLSAADLLVAQGRAADALRMVDRAQAIAPDDPKAWQVRGSILQAQGALTPAIDAFGRALTIEPRYADARIARLSLLINAGRSKEAADDIAYLSRESPKEPRANYLKAVYLAQQGDADGAREALTTAGNLLAPAAPEVLKTRAPELLLLAGTVFHGLNQLERAQAYLEAFISVAPNHLPARKLLGTVFLERRDFNRALKQLESVERVTPNDPQLLALLGGTYLGMGRSEAATRKLQRAIDLGATTPDVQGWLGMGLVQGGQTAAGIRQMTTAVDKAPGNSGLALALAMTYMQQREPRKAIPVLRKALQASPASPLLLNALGAAASAAGDFALARRSYEEAAAANPRFEPARLNLAKLDIAERKFDAASARLLAILKGSPKSVDAMREYAQLEFLRGRNKEAQTWMEKAYNTNPRDLVIATDFIDFLVNTGASAKAVEIGRSTEASYPENLDALVSLGKALVAAGDSAGAKNLLSKMTRLANFDPGRQYQIAQLQLLSGNASGAAYSLEKALSESPDYLPAKVLMVEVEQALGQEGAAETRALTLLKSNPELPRLHRSLGDIRMRTGRFAEAAESYQRALSKEPITDNAVRYLTAQLRGGNAAKGLDFMRGWVAQHPADRAAARALGEAYLRAGQYPSARKVFESLLAKGDDPQVLNSLAASQLLEGKTQEALATAKRALALSPGDPAILDTTGWALVRSGDLEVGIKHLREARLRLPRDGEIRYHLAFAYHKAGRIQEAKDEMREGLRLASDFPEAGDAKALARQLELL